MTIVALLGIGVILLLVEIVIPGGVVGLIGLICIVIGVGLGFTHGLAVGTSITVGVLIAGTIAFRLWIRYFPSSRLGKTLFLSKNAKGWKGYQDCSEELLGSIGIAHTPLRPSGTVIIDKKRIDVVTEGEAIEQGESVKILKVEGNRVVVRQVRGEGEG